MHPMYAEVHLVSENFQPCIVFAPYHTIHVSLSLPHTIHVSQLSLPHTCVRGGWIRTVETRTARDLDNINWINGWIIENINCVNLSISAQIRLIRVDQLRCNLVAAARLNLTVDPASRPLQQFEVKF